MLRPPYFSRLIELAEAELGNEELIAHLEINAVELRKEIVHMARLCLEGYLRRSTYSSPEFTGNELRLATFMHCQVALSFIQHGPPNELLTSLASDFVLLNLGPADLLLDCFHLPQGWSHEVFDPEVALEEPRAQVLKPGQAKYLDSSSTVPRLSVEPNTAGIFLRISSTRGRSQVWNFRAGDRTAVFPAASMIESSRLKIAANLLGAVAKSSDRVDQTVEVLRDNLISYPEHDVRWAALQNICLIDRVTGEGLLRAALRDPHPHVAAAARRSIERLGI